MKLGNDWRQFEEFEVVYKGKHYRVETLDGLQGYMVYVWNDSDIDTDEPVGKYYESKRNGDVNNQSICGFCEGFEEAINSEDTLFYI